MPEYCCPVFRREAERLCDRHPNRFECPDCLIARNSQGEYGFIVHDGGTSTVRFLYCPWCGQKLGEASPDTLGKSATQRSAPLESAATLGMIVRLPLVDDAGNGLPTSDRLRREALAELLRANLERTALGRFSGSDFGAEAANFYLDRIPADRWQQALEEIVGALADQGMDGGGVIAKSPPGEFNPAQTWEVVWPAGYSGEFRLW